MEVGKSYDSGCFSLASWLISVYQHTTVISAFCLTQQEVRGQGTIHPLSLLS